MEHLWATGSRKNMNLDLSQNLILSWGLRIVSLVCTSKLFVVLLPKWLTSAELISLKIKKPSFALLYSVTDKTEDEHIFL